MKKSELQEAVTAKLDEVVAVANQVRAAAERPAVSVPVLAWSQMLVPLEKIRKDLSKVAPT